MRAFVTGGSGFVGRHLVMALVQRGIPVTALARSPRTGAELTAMGATVQPGELGPNARLEPLLEGHDLVFHVAGLIAASRPEHFMAVNRDATARLAEAAATAGVSRLVLVSSLAAAGPSAPGVPLTGTEAPRPVTAYGRSKLAGEQAVRRGRTPWTIVRPPAVYGPFDRELLRVFRAARLGIAPVFGRGTLELSLVYGPDLAQALIAAAASPATVGQTLYAAHPEIVTSRALVAAIGRAVGRRVRVIGIPELIARGLLGATGALARLVNRPTLLTIDKANEFFQAAWTCDPGPLTAHTGWNALHSLELGAQITADWYRQQGWLS